MSQLIFIGGIHIQLDLEVVLAMYVATMGLVMTVLTIHIQLVHSRLKVYIYYTVIIGVVIININNLPSSCVIQLINITPKPMATFEIDCILSSYYTMLLRRALKCRTLPVAHSGLIYTHAQKQSVGVVKANCFTLTLTYVALMGCASCLYRGVPL